MKIEAILISMLVVFGPAFLLSGNVEGSPFQGAYSEIYRSSFESRNLTSSNSTTDMNSSIIQNGSLPHIYAYEDTPLMDALDLSEYFYIINGAKLNYTFGTIVGHSPWVLEYNDSILSCFPYNSGPGFENWFGDLIFNCSVKGTGDDGIWYTDDDATEILNFTIKLTVLPVNDDPNIECLMMDGKCYYDTGDGFNFTLEYDFFEHDAVSPLRAPSFHASYGRTEIDIIWSDPDGDDVIFIIDYDGGVLTRGAMFYISYNQNCIDTVVMLKMTDGNGSKMEEVKMRFSFVERYNYTIQGISFDGENISEEGMRITLFEGETKEFVVHIENAPHAMIDGSFGSDHYNAASINLLDGRLFVTGEKINRESATYRAILFIDEVEWNYYKCDFYIDITVLNINHPPNEPRILTFDRPYMVNEQIKFWGTGSDPDKKYEDFDYKWDYGDGEVSPWFDYSDYYYLYDEPGIYEVTLTIRDPFGATNSTSFEITVIEPEEEEDSFIEKNTGYLILGISLIFVVIMFAVLIMVLVGRIMEGSKKT